MDLGQKYVLKQQQQQQQKISNKTVYVYTMDYTK